MCGWCFNCAGPVFPILLPVLPLHSTLPAILGLLPLFNLDSTTRMATAVDNTNNNININNNNNNNNNNNGNDNNDNSMSFKNILQKIVRMAVIYAAFSYFSNYATQMMQPNTTQQQHNVPGETNEDTAHASDHGSTPPITHDGPFIPRFPRSMSMDLWVFLTEDAVLPWNRTSTELDPHYLKHHDPNNDTGDGEERRIIHPVWKQEHLYNDASPSNSRHINITVPLSPRIQHNHTSLYAHVFLLRHGASPHPSSPRYRPADVLHHRVPLIRIVPVKEEHRTHLLSSSSSSSSSSSTTDTNTDTTSTTTTTTTTSSSSSGQPTWRWEPRLVPTLSLRLVDFHERFQASSLPPPVRDHIVEASGRRGEYMPVLYVNEFWVLREHMLPVNESTPTATITMDVSSMPTWQWQIMMQMDVALGMQMSAEETDEIRRMLLETNPYLLAATMAVSLLHTLFDFLAFKNDISFWRQQRSTEGLSVRSMVMNAVSQFIIFLYLLDNDTSWVVLLGSGVGAVIEGWKVTRVLHIRVVSNPEGRLPWRIAVRERRNINIQDNNNNNNHDDNNNDNNNNNNNTTNDHPSDQSRIDETREHDATAMRYLSWVLYPLMVGYAGYSLVYQTHRSWYSWILNSLVGAIYTFGFIMMTPQLFINYKLKSVAHMPWKAFMYKALNTFVDDMFAFVIKMPMLHRLACFRDDLVFVVYLYQRWIYPVDRSRVNEYGQQGTADDSDGNSDGKKEKIE